MRKDLRILALAPIFVGLGTAGTHAAFDRRSVVFVECTSRDGTETKKGSGVIVTNRGDVLTAQHVVRAEKRVDGKIIWYECKGVRGTGAETPTRRLVRGRKSGQYDAILLRFVDPRPGETFDPVSYVPLTPDLQGKAITAYGVPEGGTGQIQSRPGSISETVPNPDGTITTTALTVEGMSGGPVVLNTTGGLIGIVAGANFSTHTGNYTGFAVLAAQEIATELGLSKHTDETTPPEDSRKPFEPKMVSILGGRFTMGYENCGSPIDNVECNDHLVKIEPFEVSETEITWKLWQACVVGGGCDPNDRPGMGGDEGWGMGNRPVINVSWNDAKSYVKWLKRKTQKKYRLLTEAEWEYAARAGSAERYSWGNDRPVCRTNASHGANFGQCSERRTMPVGSFKKNKFKLYDMHGNVMEWVEDCWHETYNSHAPDDGRAWTGQCIGSFRVVRGGSYLSVPDDLRSAFRTSVRHQFRHPELGFRVARSL